MDNKFKSLLTIVILGLIQLSLVNCKKDFCQGAFVTGATKLNNGSVFFVADYKWYYVVDFYKGEMPKPEKARRVSDLIPEFNHLNIVVNVPVKIIPTSKNSNKTECVRIENKDRLLFYMYDPKTASHKIKIMENDVLNDKVLDWKKVPEFAALQNPNNIWKTGEKEKKIDMERRIDTVIYGEVDIGYGNWMAMLFYQGYENWAFRCVDHNDEFYKNILNQKNIIHAMWLPFLLDSTKQPKSAIIVEYYVPGRYNYSYTWFNGQFTGHCIRLDLGRAENSNNSCDSAQKLKNFFRCPGSKLRKEYVYSAIVVVIAIILAIMCLLGAFLYPMTKKKKKAFGHLQGSPEVMNRYLKEDPNREKSKKEKSEIIAIKTTPFGTQPSQKPQSPPRPEISYKTSAF